MSTDIERLLAAAADDTDRPLSTGVDDLLVRARRSVRKTRIATVSTAVLTTGAIVAGIATWSTNRHEGTAPAGNSGGPTATIDPKTGHITEDEAGNPVVPAPPVSTLSDYQLVGRCAPADRIAIQQTNAAVTTPWDKAGPVDDRWKVVVKSGGPAPSTAMFLAPDKSMVAECMLGAEQRGSGVERATTTVVLPNSPHNLPQAEEIGLRVAKPGVTRVLVYMTDGRPHEALVGSDGFFTYDHTTDMPRQQILARIRGYDDRGRRIYEQVNQPMTGGPKSTTQPSTDPGVVLRTAKPVAPQVVVTKDPATGKALAPPPPVSPLTDAQITTRCRGVDDIYFRDQAPGASNPNAETIKAAGPVTKDWKVALKTGTGDKLTAVLISPDRKVYAWCHMLGATAKGPYDYTRGAVQANGKFADSFDFGMVPDGVAQLVVDLPKQGPTRALVSNGFYIWGLTGGNSDLQNVRVRGYDAHGKQIYTATKQIDADFD